jgi:hypothetical protein
MENAQSFSISTLKELPDDINKRLICTNFIPWYFFSRTFKKLGLKAKSKS